MRCRYSYTCPLYAVLLLFALLLWLPLRCSANFNVYVSGPVTLTQCDDEAPVVGACPVPQVWVNMTDAVQVLPTVRNGKAFATRLPFRVPLGLMWVATTSSVNITRPTLDAAINASALDLYATGTGLLAVSPDAPWDADSYLWSGLVYYPAGLALNASTGSLRYKRLPDGTLVVQHMDAFDKYVTASTNHSFNGQVRIHPSGRQVVISYAQTWHSPSFPYGQYVGIRLAAPMPNRWLASVSLSPVNGTVSGMVHHTDTPADVSYLALHNGSTMQFDVDDGPIRACVLRSTCSVCLAASAADGVACVWSDLLNGGVCTATSMVHPAQLRDVPAWTHSVCRSEMEMQRTGPCFNQSLPPGACITSGPFLLSDYPRLQSGALIPASSILPAGGVVSYIVSGAAPLPTKVEIASGEMPLALNVSTAPFHWMASVGVAHGGPPLAAISVSLDPALSSVLHVNFSVISRTSRYCASPYNDATAKCDVAVVSVQQQATLPADVHSGATTTFLVMYYLSSGVMAVHSMVVNAQLLNSAPTIMWGPLHLYSSGVIAHQSTAWVEGFDNAYPNRSFHFIPPYACLGACVHGTCDAEGVCHCSFPSLWDGPMCDVEVGTYAVQVNATYRTTVECPDCGAHGNCTDEGACRCDASHAGPRCELGCSARAHEGCDPTRSLGVCGSCSCFAGYVALPSCGTLQPGCNLSVTTGALLPNALCTLPTMSPASHASTDDKSMRLGWSKANALVVVLTLAVTVVLGAMVLQLTFYHRKWQRYHGDADDAALRPLGGVALLLPGPRLVGSAPSP